MWTPYDNQTTSKLPSLFSNSYATQDYNQSNIKTEYSIPIISYNGFNYNNQTETFSNAYSTYADSNEQVYHDSSNYPQSKSTSESLVPNSNDNFMSPYPVNYNRSILSDSISEIEPTISNNLFNPYFYNSNSFNSTVPMYYAQPNDNQKQYVNLSNNTYSNQYAQRGLEANSNASYLALNNSYSNYSYSDSSSLNNSNMEKLSYNLENQSCDSKDQIKLPVASAENASISNKKAKLDKENVKPASETNKKSNKCMIDLSKNLIKDVKQESVLNESVFRPSQNQSSNVDKCEVNANKEIEVRLEDFDLWDRFNKIGTEMVITKPGR